MVCFLQCPFQVCQCRDTTLLVPADPASCNLMNGRRVEIMELLPPAPHGDDEIHGLEHGEMLGDRLTRHVEVLAELSERLPVVGAESVEKQPSAGVGERFEDFVHPRLICNRLVAC